MHFRGWSARLFAVDAQPNGAFVANVNDLCEVSGGGYVPCLRLVKNADGDLLARWDFTGKLDYLPGTKQRAWLGGVALFDALNRPRFTYVFPQAIPIRDIGDKLNFWFLKADLEAAYKSPDPLVQFGQHAKTPNEALARLWPST